MSNRIISEESVERLNELMDATKDELCRIESDLENDDLTLFFWKEYEEKFNKLNSILRDLEDTIKYL